MWLLDRQELLNHLEYSNKWNNVPCPLWVKNVILSLPDPVIKCKDCAYSTKMSSKWNRLDYDTFHCKLCGSTFVLLQGVDRMLFCPYCGNYNGEEQEIYERNEREEQT